MEVNIGVTDRNVVSIFTRLGHCPAWRCLLDVKRKFKFAVLGSASCSEDSPETEKAYRIGHEVAIHGGVLFTGGCPGLPQAAARGAAAAGGLTIAVSPAMNREEHGATYHYPLESDVILFTGMGTRARNVVLVRSADACVFIGGGMGTLNEFTVAFDELTSKCAIGILAGTGGVTNEVDRLIALAGRPPRPHLVDDSDPAGLIRSLLDHLRKT